HPLARGPSRGLVVLRVSCGGHGVSDRSSAPASDCPRSHGREPWPACDDPVTRMLREGCRRVRHPAYGGSMTGYAGQALLDALDAGDLTDWQGLPDGIAARFATGDFATGLALVQDIAALAEDANHHPDLTLTYPAVGVRLISHDVGAVTDRDLALARAISDVARERGVDADPRAPQV